MLIFLLQSFVRENRELKQEKERKQAEREDALENGVVCLLRVKLIEYHGKYTNRNEISSNGYENWNLMFNAYKKLGGNGMIDHMKKEIEELHIDT
jgi:hypothetical protein